MACLLKVGVQYHACWMEGFHHEPRAAGVFVPGHASTSIGDVSGLAKKPSADVLMTLPTLELGKSTSNLSLEGGAPTPRRLDMSPTSPSELPPTLQHGHSQASMASESPTIPGDLGNVAPATVTTQKPPELLQGSSSSTPEPATKTEPAKPTEPEKSTEPAKPAVETPQPLPRAKPETPGTPKDPSQDVSSPAGVPSAGDNQPPEPEGNMYTDGTYWRTR